MGFPSPVSFGSVTYPGGSVLNATVPANAPILPAQAFVDAGAKFLDASVSLDVSDSNVSSIADTVLRSWANARTVFGGGYNADFSGNNLDSATIGRILDLWNDGVFWPALANSFTLDISGGTNATVTYRPEKYVLQIPSGLINTDSFDITYDGNDVGFTFFSGAALAGSYVELDTTSDQQITIGISDSPTPSQIAAKIVALFATLVHPGGWHTSAVSDVLTMTRFPPTTDTIFVRTNTANFTVQQHVTHQIDSVVQNLAYGGNAANQFVIINASSGGVVSLPQY